MQGYLLGPAAGAFATVLCSARVAGAAPRRLGCAPARLLRVRDHGRLVVIVLLLLLSAAVALPEQFGLRRAPSVPVVVHVLPELLELSLGHQLAALPLARQHARERGAPDADSTSDRLSAPRTAWTEMTNNRSFAVRRRCLEIRRHQYFVSSQKN